MKNHDCHFFQHSLSFLTGKGRYAHSPVCAQRCTFPFIQCISHIVFQ